MKAAFFGRHSSARLELDQFIDLIDNIKAADLRAPGQLIGPMIDFPDDEVTTVLGFECSSKFTRFVTNFILEFTGGIWYRPTFGLIAGAAFLTLPLFTLSEPGLFTYRFYDLLRWVVSIASVYAAADAYSRQERFSAAVLMIFVVLFNPLIPLSLPKTVWLWIDFFGAWVLGVQAYLIGRREL
jgi:uncharacterized protein DUF6804